MTIYIPDQALQFAVNAGFKNQSAFIIVAIAMTESSLNDQALYINTDGSKDRGILQINDKWHSEVSNTCAYDAQCSFKEAYRISSNGTSFTQWATYNTAKYYTNLNSITTALVSPNPLAVSSGNSISSTFDTIANSTNSVLNSVPGFKGIVEALDLIEQFQPLEIKSASTDTTSGVDYTIFGFDTSIPDPGKIASKVQKAITLPSNNIQAFIVFIATNSAATTIRGLLILIGVIVIIALVMNIQGNIAEKSSGVVSQVLPLLL